MDTGILREITATLELLFHGKLISLESPALVKRYNTALERLGISPSTLSSFRIDRLGWSPEIALEREDPFYLSAGMANPMAVIITPDQRSAPLIFPFHSYDDELFRRYFEQFSSAIADITASDSIGLYLDKEITTFRGPEDLLLVRYLIVRTVSGEIIHHASEQQSLAGQFLEDNLAWFDRTLRADIIESARLHGDLRNRDLNIPDLKFEELQTYYTRAFGGVFLLRGLQHHSHLMIIESEKQLSDLPTSLENAYGIHDEELLALLREENLLQLDLEEHVRSLDFLRGRLEHIETCILCEADPELQPEELTSAQRARRLLDTPGEATELFHELERIMRQLEDGRIPSETDLSSALRSILLRPGGATTEQNRQVIEQLLCRIVIPPPEELFRIDPSYFITEFLSWPRSKQLYALTSLGNAKRIGT